MILSIILTPKSYWTRIYMYTAFTNSVDPDQCANWSGSALFVIQYVNLFTHVYQHPGSSNLIGCTLEVGMAS